MRETDIKISFLFSKWKNIIWYRMNDDRPRGQYIHVLRDFRQSVFELYHELKGQAEYKDVVNILDDLLICIPKKIKSDDCFDTILELNTLLSKWEVVVEKRRDAIRGM